MPGKSGSLPGQSTRGWFAIHGGAGPAHYFPDGVRSLCGRWLQTTIDKPLVAHAATNTLSADKCSDCVELEARDV